MVQGSGLLSRGRASGPLVRIQHAPPAFHSLGSSIGQDNWFSPSKGGFDSPIEHQTLHGSAGRAPSSYGGVRRFESCCSVHFFGGVAERSIAPDCKSGPHKGTVVQIHPPPPFSRPFAKR